MIDLRQAQEKRMQFEHMYTEGGLKPLSDKARCKLTKMQAGCLNRRELEALGKHDRQRRKRLLDSIALEEPHLWTLFER
jgi:hypothetical protein